MERSVPYSCHGPFYERPDLWWPVYVEGVCYLDNDIFEGKTKAEIFAMPLVEPLPEPFLEPVQYSSLGSFTTPRADHVPSWQGPHVSIFTASTVAHYTTTPEPIPPVPVPAAGLLLITALAALAMKGLRG